eukprot:gene14636-biopygen5365
MIISGTPNTLWPVQTPTGRCHNKLLRSVLYPKRGTDEPLFLWQIVGEKINKGGDVAANGEWMYQLESFEANPWEAYNEAALLWVGGHAAAANRRAGSAVAAAAPDVREALRALR